MILKVFVRNAHALSQIDVEHAIEKLYDRTTIFRTLKTFLEKDIIHKVIDEGGVTKFALSPIQTNGVKYYNDHIHFKCNKCGIINCIPGLGVPKVELPEGYNIQKSNMLFQGICNLCNPTSFKRI